MSKRIVILGGCGYLGSALFLHLSKRGFKVDTVDLEWFGNKINPKNLKQDFSSLPPTFYNSYDAVVLLAGHSTVDLCNRDKKGAIKNNINNFINLLDTLTTQKIIYASSYRVYGNTKNKKVGENYSFSSDLQLYDFTKATIDLYARFAKKKYYSLRMATVNGYSSNLRENQIINKMYIQSVRSNEITAFNSEASFSILGINDFCRSVEVILSKDGRPGEYNLASFVSSIKKLSSYILKKRGRGTVNYIPSQMPSTSCQLITDKFSREFKFKFKDTVESVIESLVINKQLDKGILNDSIKLNY